MAAKPVQISIDSELLERIDSDPETLNRGRSAFVRAAVRHYLAAKERLEIDAAIRAAYGTEADEMAADVVELIGAQQWPKS